MKMQKRKFRIGQLAQMLAVERFVIRFWEKEFQLRTTRSDGGQRFYDENDLQTFTLIKKLLYEQGFTINGAKKQLVETKKKSDKKILASAKTELHVKDIQAAKRVKDLEEQNKLLTKQVAHLQKQLLKLRDVL